MLGFTNRESALEVNTNDLWLDHEARSKLIDELKVTGGVRDFDAQFRRPDGSIIWVRNNVRVSYDQNGQIAFFDGTLQDITEKKQAEEELQARNRYIETIMENAPIGFAVRTLHDGVAHFVSSKFEEIYGVPRGALNSFENFFDVVIRDPVFREEMRARVREGTASGDPARMVWENIPVQLDSGEVRYVTATGIPVFDQNLIVSTVQDVTDRVKATEALRKSEALYRAVVENSHDGIVMMDRDRRVKYVSPSYQTVSGYTPEDAIGKYGTSYLHPDDLAMTAGAFRELLQTPNASATVQYRLRHKRGEWIWVETTATNLLDDPQAQAVVLSIRDITERKRAEEALQISELAAHRAAEQLRMVNQMGLAITAGLDMERLLQTLYEQCLLVAPADPFYVALYEPETETLNFPFGYTDGERKFRSPINLREKGSLARRVVEGRQTVHIPDIQIEYSDPAVISISPTPSLTRSYIGIPLIIGERVIGILSLQNMAPNVYTPEQIHTLEMLATQAAIALQNSQLYEQVQQSESKYRELFQANKDGIAIFVLSPDRATRTFVEINEAAHAMLGYTKEEMFNLTPDVLEPEITAERTQFLKDELLSKGTVTFETVLACKDGRRIHAAFTSQIIQYGGQQAVMNIIHDITERKRAEEMMRQRDADMQRSALEERQRLARDLHDAVSQTLFSASFTSEMLLRQRRTITPRALWKNIKHLSALVTSALGEMRILLLELRPESLVNADLPTLLSHLIDAAGSRVNAEISLDAQGDYELPVEPKIAFYRIAQEALNNIIKHADASKVNLHLRIQAGAIELRVEDNGIGLHGGKTAGSKMGLSIMRERASEVGAHLKIVSEKNKGTQVVCKWKAGGLN
jgi:PAS domain S-box-containing protein